MAGPGAGFNAGCSGRRSRGAAGGGVRSHSRGRRAGARASRPRQLSAWGSRATRSRPVRRTR
eukprot:2809724-Alexandrium_andersonii.AAC.1